MPMIDGSAFSYLLFVLTLWRSSFYCNCVSQRLKNAPQASLSTLLKVNPKEWKTKQNRKPTKVTKLCYGLENHTGTSYCFLLSLSWAF
jgi:hypothetical protein